MPPFRFYWCIEIYSTPKSIQIGQYQWIARLTVPAKRESAGKYRCFTKYETTGETISGDMILQPYCTSITTLIIIMFSYYCINRKQDKAAGA